MRRVEVRLRHRPDRETLVGTLAQSERRIFFEYAPSFLDLGWELSPWKLPAKPELQEHTELGFGPLPGVFDDSLPDGWGRLLMDRLFEQRGLPPESVSELDRLLYLGARTMGALTYHPPAAETASGGPLDLHQLAEASRDVLTGHVETVLPELVRAGGSPGGARPKVVVGLRGEEIISGEDDLPEGFEPWLVKFLARHDPPDTGAVELAYARLAGEAGIVMPATRLFETAEGDRFFGVARFDRRPGNERLHMHTLGGLIHSNFRVPNADYRLLLHVAATLTQNVQDVVECFRRMVFNLVTHNHDDHVKNFAFLFDPESGWSLSPAYDLTYSPQPREHSMTVNGIGRDHTRAHCLAFAEEHGIHRERAQEVIDQVHEAAANWERIARDLGCTTTRIQQIGRAHRRLP